MRFGRWILLAALLTSSVPATPCSLAPGYFHQVTQLKGKVVGRALGPIQFQWLRRMFVAKNAELVLYDYKQPFHWDKKPPRIAQTQSNASGEFAFGTVPEGQYRLEIRGDDLHDMFDVEVTKKAKPTRWITIDASPIHPDCQGGHEFEIEN